MAAELKTEAEVLEALRQRFPAPAWAMFTGVSNGTGRHANRWADALAMSVWPSRGLEIVGFEIKVDRRDLLRELKNPKKAEAVGSYCDRWWIAAGSKKIADPAELPPAWGLLVPHGGTMKIVKDAQRLDSQPLDRKFLAAILRRAAEQYDIPALTSQIRREIREEIRQETTERLEARYQDDMERMRDQMNKANAEMQRVQQKLCTASEAGYGPGVVGRAITLLQRLEGWSGGFSQLDNLLRCLERDQEEIGKLVGTLRTIGEVCEPLKIPKEAS